MRRAGNNTVRAFPAAKTALPARANLSHTFTQAVKSPQTGRALLLRVVHGVRSWSRLFG
jgi:hypothetical protein